jgi:hypothetical protein
MLCRVLVLALLLTTACAADLPPESGASSEWETTSGALTASLAFGQTAIAKAGKTGVAWTFAASGGGTFQVVAKASQKFTVNITRQFGGSWKSVSSQTGKGVKILLVPALGPNYRVTVSAPIAQPIQVTLTCKLGKCQPPPKPVDCQAAFQQAIAPTLQGLLYMSESDRPFEVVSWPSATQGAVAPAELLALLKLPAGTPVEVRTLTTWFQPLLKGDDQVKYAQMKKILAAHLTDVIVLRVGTIQIGVYVVGRTACGTLTGLATVAIET